ncbi:1-deoxy-D-xylulose-5-phosphate synthase [Cellulosilyticum sp. I15G10I2]|uniref:1-deoxy-D-xylulose-5-phosphate synthase n=1 Tax=Cellulosilyticum sp. I15G10I2 TaxID=1892843 RepID=UPI00085CAD3B|nr:1-deoxy-D-xylulose-5-phosphate synthase [Cellulosilyticum sp. I15G10I2]
MLDLLKSIYSPEDVKKLKTHELIQLAKDIRNFLVGSLSQTGGHLASNLGVVELTVALHYVFDLPQDKIIWDVGHQAYVHKLLTGRRKYFKHLRKLDGLSGFPKKKESSYDVFETGHSSTSISAALGMAAARDLKGEDHKVIAVIGDGALTGGMAFEALNHAGRGHNNLIVILNDNEMSISKNVGGLCKYLNKLRSSKDYLKVKEDVEEVLEKVPVVGMNVVKVIKRTKGSLKSLLIQNTLFEQLGITYLGPVDGHCYEELIALLENAKIMKGPVLIHVKTKKGKGYKLAEQNPSLFHGIGPFDITTGELKSKSNPLNFSASFGSAMCTLAQEQDNLVAISAAMPDGTGLLDFARAYPRRFFDVGIAEQHAVTFAAGLATEGYRPVVAIYSSFLQRAYDQILHDVCLQNLPVIFAVDRAGLVGEDGATHQGVYDIAYLSSMPHMKVLSPKMPEEIEAALRYALTLKGPVAIRYPKGTTHINSEFINDYQEIGFKTLKKGNDLVILAVGRMVEQALLTHEYLIKQNIEAAIVEVPCVYPLDETGLQALAKRHRYIFTIEDGIISGGFGEKVFSYLVNHDYNPHGRCLGFQNGIINQGDIKNLFIREGLAEDAIARQIMTILQKESK